MAAKQQTTSPTDGEIQVTTAPDADSTKTTAPKAKGEEVSVPKEVLENILDRLEKYQDEVAQLKEAQKEYEQTASQDQILKIEKLRASGKLIKSVKLHYYDNNLVVGWESIDDDVYVEPGTGKLVELQKTRLKFFDGKTQEVTQLEYMRRKLLRSYEVIKEGKDRDGNMLYTVLTEGGREVEIDGRFVN